MKEPFSVQNLTEIELDVVNGTQSKVKMNVISLKMEEIIPEDTTKKFNITLAEGLPRHISILFSSASDQKSQWSGVYILRVRTNSKNVTVTLLHRKQGSGFVPMNISEVDKTSKDFGDKVPSKLEITLGFDENADKKGTIRPRIVMIDFNALLQPR